LHPCIADQERIKALGEDIALSKRYQLDNHVWLNMESIIYTIKIADFAGKSAEYQALGNRGLAE
jgi:hypothetical protein